MSDFTADEVRVLKALASGLLTASKPASNGTGNGSDPTDTFSDAKLDSNWADKIVSKELPRWNGDPMMGRRFSDCPPEWHDSASGFYEFKARKGREEVPVRMNDKGKPWHEQDSFTAKLHRTWAKRLRARRAEDAQRASAMGPDPKANGEASDDSIPF